ncbi:syntaxin-binding protein [Ascoidea rubescens DSM 1968]|uniref:Sec1-like protein n=1 Tax=Ascoidea rubescens DSM 1968 TaxID=1344418 RepID=A0A1D2VIZ0_9ASCO|nr:Sec1-like protein [Ascoidea rubescens DSM 1968]ODV61596.1 Sec1-like protein [Ascoidea rubescens DSM 1968]
MLNLNQVPSTTTVIDDSNSRSDVIWKVLILDSKSTAIVSSILRVNDLLKSGITMHYSINSVRSPLPDVPVIYFIEPLKSNIDLIIEDLKSEKYSEFYINFTSNLPRNLLEYFANLVSLTNKSFKIKQVFDQYLNYLVTEPNLFSLNLPNTYSLLNNPKINEDQINLITEQISNGLFNTILTLNSIPIIRAPRGGPAELIAQSLDSKLKDHVINAKLSNNSSISSNRSVLILLDRNFDLASMFAHSWIYQCMVFDIFKLERNTITITKSDEKNTDKIITTKYDIDSSDFFWNSNSQIPFPDAVENVEKELNNYKIEAKELTNKTGGISSLNEISNQNSDQYDTQQIQLAVKKLPYLTKKKQIIDMHMNILASLLKELESKHLDFYFEVEQNINDPKIRQDFLNKLSENPDNKEILNDKLRTYLFLYLLCDLPADFTKKVEKILTDLNCDLSPLNYIKRAKDVIKLATFQLNDSSNFNSNKSANNSQQKTSNFSGLSSRLFGLAEGTGVGSIISNLQKLLPEKNQIPITNIVESIMDPSKSTSTILNTTDDYLYFDPLIIRGTQSKTPKRNVYNLGITFVVGDGNYLEYQNLQEWCNNASNTNSSSLNPTSTTNKLGGKNVIYGSTNIVTPKEFLKECSSLVEAASSASK